MRHRPIKQLRVCPLCGGYMQTVAAVHGQRVGGRHWKDETYHRSFGGKEVRKFACEKCQHIETFQVDELESIGEDD